MGQFFRAWVPVGSKSKILLWTPVVLACFFVAGLIVFAACFGTAFATGSVYMYSTPLTAMWCGICTMWLSGLLCFWWFFLGQRFSVWGHWFSFSVCTLFGVCGLINLISFACSPNEAAASVMSLLWISLGAFGCVSSFIWINEAKQNDGFHDLEGEHHQEDHEGQLGHCSCPDCCCKCCSSCCTGRNWLLALGMLALIFLGVFGIGFTIQAAYSAADYNNFPPVGKLYTVNVGGKTLTLHMHCSGPLSSNTSTLIFQHGGGSSSVAGMGLMSYWTAAQRRVCIYDRLGYGWTPSLYLQSSILNPTSGDVLVQLLQQAQEPGPFVCVGHSAGAAACVEFALSANQSSSVRVTGIAMLDGYPDLIRPGVIRPAQPSASASGILQSLVGFSVIAGPTGLSRGQLGAVSNPATFSPPSAVPVFQALYAQSRFWLAQYSDVNADNNAGSAGYIYRRVPAGQRTAQNLYDFGEAFPFHVVHIPAFATVNASCAAQSAAGTWCCSPNGFNTGLCRAKREDSLIFLAQAQLYASTMGSSGQVIIGPDGSDHSFVYTTPYTQWIANTVLAQFP